MEFKTIDADGHVIEDDSLFDYVDASYRERDHQLSWDRLFPSLDFHHIGGHTTRSKKTFGGGKRVGAQEWLAFVELANGEYTFRFGAPGYETLVEKVDLSPLADKHVTVELKKTK